MFRSASSLVFALILTAALVSVARADEIILVGAVEKPGRYSVAQHKSVIALITAAGGLQKNGCTVVTISGRMEGGQARTYRINLWELLADFQTDWPLQKGDIVSIPEHMTPCMRDENAVNTLFTDYLKARAENSKPPAGWAQRLASTSGGDGKTVYRAASKASGSPPRP